MKIKDDILSYRDRNIFKKILKKGIKTEPFDKKAPIHSDKS